MTSGTKIVGSLVDQSSDFYRYKKWTGGDDRANRKAWCSLTRVVKEKQTSLSIRQNVTYPYVPPYWTQMHLSEPRLDVMDLGFLSYDGNVWNQLLNDLASDIRGHDFDGTVFLGESKEAVEMVVQSVKACFNLLLALKRRNFQDALRALPRILGQTHTNRLKKALDRQDIGAAWLAVQYGWLPLINDLQEALKAFEAVHEKPLAVRFKRKRKAGPPRYIDLTADSMSYRAPAYYQTWASATAEISGSVSALDSLGLTDLRTVAWELVPFSFVADWFIPVGDYLRAVTFFGKVQFSRCIYNEHQVLSFSYQAKPPIYPNNTNWTQLGFQKGYIMRSVRDVWPIGGLVRLPSLKSWEKSLSAAHLKNAAALIDVMIDTQKRK